MRIENLKPEKIKTWLHLLRMQIRKSGSSGHLTWDEVSRLPTIRLYAGDVPDMKEYDGLIGLSLTRSDSRHIQHDLRKPFPLPDSTVESFQSEDVFEHIRYEELLPIINEVFRILKPGGFFRLSLPDYGCDALYVRSVKDAMNNIVFDEGGGGTPENPGHVWFPRIDNVKSLLRKSLFGHFGKIQYLHYYTMHGSYEMSSIDYAKGHVQRTPDFDKRVQKPYRPMSMVIDMIKK